MAAGRATTTSSSRGGSPGGALPPGGHGVPARVVARTLRSSFEIAVIGEPGPPAHARDPRPAARNGVPHGFHATDSERGEELLADVAERRGAGGRSSDLHGRARRSSTPPTRSSSAAYGVNTELADPARLFDVIVVGAGPAGLAAAVYASSEGLRHARDRARDDRRPGGLELADPQLPRLRARRERRRARPARLPAGVGLRRRVPAHVARSSRCGIERRAGTGSAATTASRSPPGAWCSPPASPTGGSGSPGSRTCRAPACTTGRRRSEALGARRRGRLRDRRRQLGRPGGDASRRARRRG